MAVSPPQLPSEVWNHVFGYLSVADKLSVRACCKYFKKLIDHGSLWKGWAVVLGFQNGSYNSQFWASLRRKKVTSAVVRSTKVKDWKQLAMCLPALTTVIMDQSSQETLNCLKNFPHLKHLVIRSSRIIEESVWMVHSILTCLPKLKHLSLTTVHVLYPPHNHPRPKPGAIGGAHGQDGATALSSLELINYSDHSLPEDAMRLVPGLQTLAVFYQHSDEELAELGPPVCHLKTWLVDLPQLTTLVIVKGPSVYKYVNAIPATVTSLTLRVAGISSEEMAAVAVQVPDLLHLHMDPWPSHLGALTAQIPHLFPKLKSLKIRHEHVPEKDFLHLHKLQDLKYLEILDGRPNLSELTMKLQTLTNHRLRVTTFPCHRDILACPCICQVY
ncbi:uncharacterized protein LOC116034418 [Scomber scombrus]|uniref:Uncharacterized protein LOC116034418 n=1 Tax=Scomber scombrus TaxID=13677 RepID=A0AAV1NH14_SCOSC